jgi:NADPH-dependent 2,4-dienoyl-CoA reductase/sulfur reductase-like enzyme
LVGILGEEVSTWLMGLAHGADVELRVEQKISDVTESPGGLRISFDDGTEEEVGAVVVGVGVQTNVEWLDSSGLILDDGVVVDEHLLASARVAAIGDVARFAWPNSTGTESVRIEHWEVANGHASALAKYWMTGEVSTQLMVPYFWSDQYGKKIQMLGHPRPDDDVQRVSGSDDEGKWLALYSRDGVVTGLVTLNNPRALVLSRPLLEERVALDNALDRAPWAT